MAFNIGAFVGGLSDSISAKLLEEREEEARIRLEERADKKQRDKEARAAGRRASELKAEKQAEIDAIAEKLALVYTPEQAAEILGQGKAAGEFALNKATTYMEAGQNPSQSYALQLMEQQRAGAPNEQQRIADQKPTPFAQRFAPLKTELVSKAKSFEARLVELDDRMSRATSQEERARLQSIYDTTSEKYAAFRSSTDTEKTDWFSKTSIDSMVNNAVNLQFEGKDFVNRTPENIIKSFIAGNEADVAVGYGRAFQALKERQQSAGWKDSKEANVAITELYKIYNTTKKQIVTDAKTSWNNEIAAANAAGNDKKAREIMANGTSTYIPLKERVIDGAVVPMDVDTIISSYGDAKINTVIEYVYNRQRVFAVKSSSGWLWGHEKKEEN
jgi:hypothetical protein